MTTSPPWQVSKRERRGFLDSVEQTRQISHDVHEFGTGLQPTFCGFALHFEIPGRRLLFPFLFLL
jgi:hypothetical protein